MLEPDLPLHNEHAPQAAEASKEITWILRKPRKSIERQVKKMNNNVFDGLLFEILEILFFEKLMSKSSIGNCCTHR